MCIDNNTAMLLVSVLQKIESKLDTVLKEHEEEWISTEKAKCMLAKKCPKHIANLRSNNSIIWKIHGKGYLYNKASIINFQNNSN
jgi:hypothetical protein